jgi:hypothetical protein
MRSSWAWVHGNLVYAKQESLILGKEKMMMVLVLQMFAPLSSSGSIDLISTRLREHQASKKKQEYIKIMMTATPLPGTPYFVMDLFNLGLHSQDDVALFNQNKVWLLIHRSIPLSTRGAFSTRGSKDIMFIPSRTFSLRHKCSSPMFVA